MPNKDEIEDAIKVLSQPSVEYIYPHGASQINMVRTDIRNLAITALQAMSDGWIPTEERLPTKDDADADGFVMIHCADWHATGIDKYTRVDDGLTTHWRKLPQPPEGT